MYLKFILAESKYIVHLYYVLLIVNKYMYLLNMSSLFLKATTFT